MTEPLRCEVLVIGAGLSGLTAALHLQENGIDSQVIEAQNRVGGRVHSMRQLGSNKEAGGAYIGAGYRHVIGAAKRYGVKLIDVTPTLEFFREQELVLEGRIIRQSEWPTHSDNPFPEKDKALMPWNYSRVLIARESPLQKTKDWLNPNQAHNDVPLSDWMKGLGLNDRAIKLGYGMNVSFGDNAQDVSALLMFFRAAFSLDQRKQASKGVVGFTALNGVQRIPETMAENLYNEVHYGKVVTNIDDSGEQAEVLCTDGTIYKTPQIICSLPFGVLRNIKINPTLTGLQQEAVKKLPSQPVTQLYFAHRSDFWEADGLKPSMFTDGVAGMLAAARNGEDPTKVTSFTAWAMGPNAARLDSLPPKQAADLVIKEIEAVRPAARGQLEFLGLHSWGNDPFAQGGWAYFRPGQITSFGATMGAPHGRILFCGEHLGLANRGMEGAMESGTRIAEEIVTAV